MRKVRFYRNTCIQFKILLRFLVREEHKREDIIIVKN